jgi:uncharacterized membrane protein YiaA
MKVKLLILSCLFIISTNAYSYGGYYSTLGLSNKGGYGNVGILLPYFDAGIEFKKNDNVDATTFYVGTITPICKTSNLLAICFANIGYGSKGSMIKVGARIFLKSKGFFVIAYEEYPQRNELSSFNLGYGFSF